LPLQHSPALLQPAPLIRSQGLAVVLQTPASQSLEQQSADRVQL
jgi:hypothetical protein